MIRTIDKKTVLILIDLQKGIAGNPGIYRVKETIQQANRLLECFHRAKLPVVLVHVDPTQGAWSYARADQSLGFPKDEEKRKEVQEQMNRQGFCDFVDDLNREDSDLEVLKHTWNAFFETPLHQLLQNLKVTQIVLGGISTSIGVEGTARAASEFGYHLSFPVDAMTDSSRDAHNHSVEVIFPRIGEVGTTDDILRLIVQD